MQLIGQAICHKTFGTGVVTERNDTMLTIRFPQGEKKFIYPDAFSGFLTLENAAMQRKISGILTKLEEEKDAERQALQEEQERIYLLRNLKITPNAQAVFDIKPEAREKTFSDWSVFTGHYLSGVSKGEARIPERIKPNSLCLLTGCDKGDQEENRRILGAFMVTEDFLGGFCRDGVIHAHPIYRFTLRREDQVAFWPYFEQQDQAPRWGNASFKYVSNQTVQKILFDLKATVYAQDGQELGESLYRYFCRINRLQLKQGDD